MSHQEEKRSDSIQALTRAMEVLQKLKDFPEGVQIRRLALEAGLSPSVTQRILHSLEESNLVISSERGYRLGPALIQMGYSVYSFNIISAMRPLLLNLASSMGETAHLVVISRDRGMVVDQAIGCHPLMAATRIGTTMPLHGTASGKALLSTLPQDELQDFRTHVSLMPLTPRTIVDWGQLDAELESVRRKGLAFEHQENALGICSIATPLAIPGTIPVAVSVPIPTRRYREVEDQVCEALNEFRHTMFRRWEDKSRAVPA